MENIEEVLTTLRQVKVMTKGAVMGNTSSVSQLIEKIKTDAVLSAINHRRKRSNSFRDFGGRGGWGMAFSKKTITWRLVRYKHVYFLVLSCIFVIYDLTIP